VRSQGGRGRGGGGEDGDERKEEGKRRRGMVSSMVKSGEEKARARKNDSRAANGHVQVPVSLVAPFLPRNSSSRLFFLLASLHLAFSLHLSFTFHHARSPWLVISPCWSLAKVALDRRCHLRPEHHPGLCHPLRHPPHLCQQAPGR